MSRRRIVTDTFAVLFLFYALSNFFHLIAYPHICCGTFTIICFCKHVYTIILSEFFHLRKRFFISFRINRKGCTSSGLYYRECRNITWAICYIYHIMEINTT